MLAKLPVRQVKEFEMMRVVYISGIANTAHAYNDALRRVGSAAKIGKGGTEEIGMCKLSHVYPSRFTHLRGRGPVKQNFWSIKL